MKDNSKPRRIQKRRIAILALAGMLLSSVALLGGHVAADSAGNVPDYYDNETYSGADEGWFGDGDASLEQVLNMTTKIPTYVVGTGELDQSKTGYVGLLLSGIIMAGAALGAVMGAGTGPVGGTIVALVTGFGLVSIGFAPGWTKVIMLFGIGALTALAFRRVLE